MQIIIRKEEIIALFYKYNVVRDGNNSSLDDYSGLPPTIVITTEPIS